MSGHLRMVRRIDIELLPVADSIPQPVGRGGALGGEFGLSDTGVEAPQKRMRQGEVRIGLGDALHEGKSGGPATAIEDSRGGAVIFQGLQRRSGSLFERGVVLSKRCQR